MARPLRIEFPGAFYHITARGNARSTIFLEADDRRFWITLLSEVCEQFKWQCYAYCQMGNHFHLLIETPEPTLSRGMRQLNGVYTQRFNRRHAKCGHVLQGRYHAVIVDQHAYLLELVRYVLLNPVRAGLVERVDQWRWSSYRSTCAQEQTSPWLAATKVLGLFGGTHAKAIAHFRRFVAAGLTARSPWRDLQKEIYLGDDNFIEVVQTQIDHARRLDAEIPHSQRSKPLPTLSTVLNKATTVDATLLDLYRSGHHTQREIAHHLDVHYATISRRLRKAKMLTRKI
jgi:putative transposase